MSLKTLYNKYRPQQLKDVVGQKKVISSILSASRKKEIPHSIILTGIQGTGKTTIARIIAKILNCENPINGEPCNQCNTCKSISDSQNSDIVELDAASERGIDDIRNIRNISELMPMFGKCRVFIIDEAHDLTQSAMDAILKKLEETPEKVYFIFCTTAIYKLPKTVQSRCVIYRLWMVDANTIFSLLKSICDKEKIEYTEEGLIDAAKIGAGSVRDSISIIETLRQIGISKETVYENSTSINPSTIDLLFDSLYMRDLKKYLISLEDMFQSGISGRYLYNSVINEILQIIYVSKGINRDKLIPKYQLDKYNKYADAFSNTIEKGLDFLINYYSIYEDTIIKAVLISLYKKIELGDDKNIVKKIELGDKSIVEKTATNTSVTLSTKSISPSNSEIMRKYAYWLCNKLCGSILLDSTERVLVEVINSLNNRKVIIECINDEESATEDYSICLSKMIELKNTKEIINLSNLIQKGFIKWSK